MTAQLSRRSFLTALGVGGVVLATPKVLLAEPEPVRRYWQVGANLRSVYAEPVWLENGQGFSYIGYSASEEIGTFVIPVTPHAPFTMPSDDQLRSAFNELQQAMKRGTI